MSKLSLIAALALGGLMACSTLVTAQDAPKDAKKGGKRGFTVEQRMERMTTALDLTDAQKPKVKAVLEETNKKFQDLAPEDRRTKGRDIRDEETKKLKEILTADQFTKYQEMSQRKGKKGQDGEKKAEKKAE
jgi:Spy/CpxP family protein refolding chaperone